MAVPDNEICAADPIACSRSKVAEVRERRPFQGYTDGEVQRRRGRGRGDGGSGEGAKIPGRSNTWDRIDKIRYRWEGVDHDVNFLDNRDEGE